MWWGKQLKENEGEREVCGVKVCGGEKEEKREKVKYVEKIFMQKLLIKYIELNFFLMYRAYLIKNKLTSLFFI